MKKENKIVYGSAKAPTWLWRFTGILLINAMLFFVSQLLITALPIYLKELSGSDSIVGICTGIGTGASLLVRPFAGLALDRIGRNRVLLFGAFLMAIALLLYPWFPIISVLVAMRFIFGLGWGISTTASNTIVADIIPGNRFGEWMGYFSLSQSLPLALAPAIGLVFMETSGYNGLMFIAAGMLVPVMIGVAFFRYNTTVDRKKQRFAPYEKSALMPAFLAALVGMGLGTVFTFAILFGKSKGFEHVGWYFTFFAVSLFISRPLVGRMNDRHGFSTSVIAGFLTLFVSFLMLWWSSNESVFLLAALLQGAAYGAVQTSLQTMAVLYAPIQRKGAASATYFTGFDAGNGIGSLIAGILARALGYNLTFGILSLPMIAGVVIYLATAQRQRCASVNKPEDLAFIQIGEQSSDDEL